MKLALATISTLLLTLCKAHKGHHHVPLHQKISNLMEKLEANPPKCRNNQTICKEPENEYPRELVELTMKDFHVPEGMEFYSDYFDKRAKYLRWLFNQSKPEEMHCRSQLVEVFLPKVAQDYKGDPVYIIQQEPYNIKRLAYFKCIDVDKVECHQDYFFDKIMTLDQSGDIKGRIIAYPFGCVWTHTFVNDGSNSTTGTNEKLSLSIGEPFVKVEG